MSAIRCRPAELRDVEAIAALHADSWRRNYRGAYLDSYLDGDVLSDRRAVWRGRIMRPEATFRTIVAQRDEAFAGFAHTTLDDDPTWGALLENLFEFKRLYDSEASLEEALPELVLKYPHRYRNTTLKELSDEMHAAMIPLNLSGLVNDACDEDFDPVLTPAQTYQKLLRHETEKVRFTEMPGRIAAVMLVPYPPGIPMSMPGERLGSAESPVIKLILAVEEFGKRFPGFEREVHGIEVDAEGNYWMRAVIETTETTEKKKNGNGNGKQQRPPNAAPPVKKKKRASASPATTPEVPLTGLSSQR